MKPHTKIAVLGAGSWGSAIAIHLATVNRQVFLWGHNPQDIDAMLKYKVNQKYLPEIPLPANLIPSSNLNECLEHANHIIIAVPSHAFAELLAQVTTKPKNIAWLTKGINPNNHQLLSELVFAKWGVALPIAVISGPSFAREVADKLPTAIVIAGNNFEYLQTLQTIFHSQYMRVYLSQDFIGVQLCGAIKNVIAIACGISDGLNYGANAKAALITRGLAEMLRLGHAFGAQDETFIGLAGAGDLILTCTDNQSRNRRFGLAIGTGISPDDAEADINQVVEGKGNAAQVCSLAKQFQIDMPICEAVNAILLKEISAEQAVQNLMNRPPKDCL